MTERCALSPPEGLPLCGDTASHSATPVINRALLDISAVSAVLLHRGPVWTHGQFRTRHV